MPWGSVALRPGCLEAKDLRDQGTMEPASQAPSSSRTGNTGSTGRDYPAKPEAVYFYGTCLVDMVYPQGGLAAVELLEAHGLRVIYPQDQTCCGQPPYNSGFNKEAREVARAQMALFPKPYPVVVPSGSCGAMMHRHYPHLFHGEPDAPQAIDLAARVFEWSDFMTGVLGGLPPLARQSNSADTQPDSPIKVAYHPSCHLLREMGVRDAPLTLLSQLPGVRVVSVADAEACCGFGGTFSVKMEVISGAMVKDKATAIAQSGAEVLVSMDSGCLMNIGGALDKAGHPIRSVPLPLFIKEQLIKERLMDGPVPTPQHAAKGAKVASGEKSKEGGEGGRT